VSEAVKTVRTCQNLSEQNGTCLGLLLLHVGPNGDGFGGQAFMEHYSAMGCFIDIEWVKLNNIPMRPLTNPIPVYNVDGTANDASMITDITDVILRYENHPEHTQLAVTHLGKQSIILGYNWLHNHNPEINWQTKDVKMSHCPLQCSTCKVEDKCETKIWKSTTIQINACWAGAFPMMVEEVDKDESSHMNTDETDEGVQDTCPAFDDDLDSVRGMCGPILNIIPACRTRRFCGRLSTTSRDCDHNGHSQY
jgi:hypothetical protein